MTGHDDVEAAESHTAPAVDQDGAVHWHGYDRLAAEQTTPTQADRAIRLAAEPKTVLTSPDAVAAWVALQISGRGDRIELWISATSRWVEYTSVDSPSEWQTLETEFVLRAAQARSVYVAVWSSSAAAPAPRFEVYAEAVSALECPVDGDHLDGRRQR